MIDEKSFGEEEKRILEEIIKKNTVPTKDNFFDYYNDEEKQAIEYFDKLIYGEPFSFVTSDTELEKYLKIYIKLFKKQQKEIEKLEQRSRSLDREAQLYFERTIMQTKQIEDMCTKYCPKKTELERKDKIIDLMIEKLVGKYIVTKDKKIVTIFRNVEQVKRYFENEVYKDES